MQMISSHMQKVFGRMLYVIGYGLFYFHPYADKVIRHVLAQIYLLINGFKIWLKKSKT